MSINLIRVKNLQTLPTGMSRDGSILLDKIDRSVGNSSNPPYAQLAKQPVYVPKYNPLNTLVAGYVDLVATDEVLLSLEDDGSIGGLTSTTPARVAVAVVNSDLIATPIITSGSNTTETTLAGRVFLSVSPDVTYVEFESPAGLIQLIPSSSFTTFTATSIVVPDTAVTIGSVAAGWKTRVFANSKYSNQVTLS